MSAAERELELVRARRLIVKLSTPAKRGGIRLSNVEADLCLRLLAVGQRAAKRERERQLAH